MAHGALKQSGKGSEAERGSRTARAACCITRSHAAPFPRVRAISTPGISVSGGGLPAGSTARKIHYYKCIGSDSWRKLGGPVCDNRRLVRQDLLDQIVWAEVIRLLEDPTLIQQELNRRLEAARSSDPTKKREQSLQRELTHVDKGIERLLTAYQEALMSIEQLRERMPVLRQREQAIRAELQAITDQANDRAVFL